MLQSFDFTGSKQIQAQGRFLTYQASNAADIGADERIAVRVNGQPLGDFYVGDSIELPSGANRWEVVPYAANLTGYVLIGDGSVTTNRTGGALAVMNGERGRVMAGRQFWGIVSRQGIAAKYSTVGVICNVGKLAVNSITLHVKAAQILMLGKTTGKPTTDQISGTLNNKRMSLAASANCELAGGTCSTYPPTVPTDYASFTQLGLFYFAANDRQRLNFDDTGPLILEAGSGLFITTNTVALDLGFEVDAEEF